MKKNYIFFLMIFCLMLSAQEKATNKTLKSVETMEIVNFKLFPNPATAPIINITTKDNAKKDIVIYNIFGEVVLKQRLINKQLNITKLVSGMYLIKVTENNKTTTRKLVVK